MLSGKKSSYTTRHRGHHICWKRRHPVISELILKSWTSASYADAAAMAYLCPCHQ